MHTRKGSKRAWHAPESGAVGLLWEVPSCTPPPPGHYRGNVAERQRSPRWGGFAAPGTRLEPPRDPGVFVTRSLPKTGMAGGHCEVAGDQLGVMSWVCISCHVRTPWRDLPAPKVTALAGTLLLPTPASCAGHGMCSSGLSTALSPWRGATSALPLHSLTFPCLGPLCPRNDPYLSPVCAVAPMSCLLNVPVQVPSEFPVTPVSPARLCHLVSHVPAVPSSLLEPRMFQCPLCVLCVSCVSHVPHVPSVSHASPHMCSQHVPCLSPVCVPASRVSPLTPPCAPLTCLVCLQRVPTSYTCPQCIPWMSTVHPHIPRVCGQRPHVSRVSLVCPMHPMHTDT